LQKRSESDRIAIGGMDDENDTKKETVSSSPINYLLQCFGGLKLSNILQIEKNTTGLGTM